MSNTLTDLPRLDALYHRLEAYRTRYWDTNFPRLVARLKEIDGAVSFQIPRKPIHTRDYWQTYEYSFNITSQFETYAMGTDTEGPDRHPDLARAIHHFEHRRMQQLEIKYKLRDRILEIITDECRRRRRSLCIEVNGHRYLVSEGTCSMFCAVIDEDVVKL